MADHLLARVLSSVSGWIYFLAWSFSFYPQPLLNWRRRSTAGFSIDFQGTNVFGFICYTVYTGVFLLNDSIRHQYSVRHPRAPMPTVRVNDFAFALHGLLICVLIYTQFFPRLWNFRKETPPQKLNAYVLTACTAAICWIAAVAVAVVLKGNDNGTDARTWAWIDVIYTFSYVKVLISLIKYTPQIWKNYKRQSTVGWSIYGMLLDFIGGVFSIVQLVIDCSLQGDWKEITGNPAKVALALFSMAVDLIFMLQHYVLYRHARSVEEEDSKSQLVEEQRPLLHPDP